MRLDYAGAPNAPIPEGPDGYTITPEALDRVRRVMVRLHSENRMNGDEMRDLGHLLDLTIRDAEPFTV